MLQYTLKYESVRTRMPKFLCLFYLVFLSPPNTALPGQQLQSLPRRAPSSRLHRRALLRPLQHRPHPLHCRAPWRHQTAHSQRRPAVPPHAHAGLFSDHNCRASGVLCVESQELESEGRVRSDCHFGYRAFRRYRASSSARYSSSGNFIILLNNCSIVNDLKSVILFF